MKYILLLLLIFALGCDPAPPIVNYTITEINPQGEVYREYEQTLPKGCYVDTDWTGNQGIYTQLNTFPYNGVYKIREQIVAEVPQGWRLVIKEKK